jgi:hypothetical protein
VHCSLEDWGKFAQLHIAGFNGRIQNLWVQNATFAKLYQTPHGQIFTYGGWLRVPQSWAGGDALTFQGSNTFNYASIWIAPSKGRTYMAVTNIGGESAAAAMNDVVLKMVGGAFDAAK